MDLIIINIKGRSGLPDKKIATQIDTLLIRHHKLKRVSLKRMELENNNY